MLPWTATPLTVAPRCSALPGCRWSGTWSASTVFRRLLAPPLPSLTWEAARGLLHRVAETGARTTTPDRCRGAGTTATTTTTTGVAAAAGTDAAGCPAPTTRPWTGAGSAPALLDVVTWIRCVMDVAVRAPPWALRLLSWRWRSTRWHAASCTFCPTAALLRGLASRWWTMPAYFGPSCRRLSTPRSLRCARNSLPCVGGWPALLKGWRVPLSSSVRPLAARPAHPCWLARLLAWWRRVRRWPPCLRCRPALRDSPCPRTCGASTRRGLKPGPPLIRHRPVMLRLWPGLSTLAARCATLGVTLSGFLSLRLSPPPS